VEAASLKRIDVAVAGCPYPVWIGHGLLAAASDLLGSYARDGRLVVVTDAQVWAAQGTGLQAGLGAIRAEPIVVPAGESSKSWTDLQQITERLIELGVERADTILAFGGGMVGDLAGFAAAICKRGCFYIQLPTTLLAQVDSGIGGKTAINSAAGKNLVGAFHQPSAVLADIGLLETLPDRELRAGYAEVVKYGLLGDPAFFDWCEANGAALLAGHRAHRLHAVETCVRAKAERVASDVRDLSGGRALLNLGHTFAHALEAEAGLDGSLLHGEAVGLGMALAFRFSAGRGLCSWADADRVAAHIATAGLPVTLAEVGSQISGEQLVTHMLHDKKAHGGRLRFILVRGIGRAFLAEDVDAASVAAFLNADA
jgi:3-dehydroquinate synthase